MAPRVAAVGVVCLVLLGLAEIGVRVILKTNPETGIRVLGRVPLLPYVPDAERARAALALAKDSTYVQPDPDLGWSLRPSGASEPHTANAQGIRAAPDRVYTSSVPPGRVRVALFGDSFTHGDDLPLEDTWSDLLERSDPKLEVLNFGIPGYGTDQAFLRYRRDGKKFQHSAVVLAIWPEDIVRNLNIFRFYMTPSANLGGPKPRFVSAGGRLAVIDQPVMTRKEYGEALIAGTHPLFEHEFWIDAGKLDFPFYYHLATVRGALSVLEAYQRREVRHAQYFEPGSEANRLQLEMAKVFAEEVKATGARPFVAIVPMRDFIPQHGSGGFPLVAALKEAGLDVIDFGPAFASHAAPMSLFLPDGHLNRAGNEVLVEQTKAALQKAGLL